MWTGWIYGKLSKGRIARTQGNMEKREEKSAQKSGSTERRTQANPPLGGGVGGGRFAWT